VIRDLKYILISLTLAGSLIPAQAFANSPEALGHNPAPEQTSSAITVYVASAMLPVAEVKMANGVAGPGCELNSQTTSTYVQDTGLINLNQAASCFALQASTVAIQSELVVAEAMSTAEVRVMEQEPLSFMNILPGSPVSATSPVVPAPVLAIAIGLIVLAWQRAKKNLVKASIALKQALTLTQLQVMRC
jgi:hypothetical protein